MGWLETRGALLRQLRGVLERNGWEADVGGYEYLRYRKGGSKGRFRPTGGLSIGCTITPYRDRHRITGYWVTVIIPLMDHPLSGERPKLRRFRTPIDEGINEATVLAKLNDIFDEG